MECRGWMRDPSKQSEEYIRGVNEFLDFAFQNSEVNGKILCPCTKCANCQSCCRTSVYEHLIDPRHGFLRGYRQWVFHGEKPVASSSTTEQHIEMKHDMDGLIDVFAMHPIEEPFCDEGKRNPQVQGPEKRGRARCTKKIPKSKKLKVSLSENEELRDRVEHMESMLANILTLIQNRFSGEDVNDIIQAARQVPYVSSALGHLSSSSSDTKKDNEYGEN